MKSSDASLNPSCSLGVITNSLFAKNLMTLVFRVSLQNIIHLESFAWCRVTWKDSGCDSKRGISAAYNVLVVDSYNPDIVLGPPCTACEIRVPQTLVNRKYGPTFN